MASKILFSTAAYDYLKNELLVQNELISGQIESKLFPDGEIYHRLNTEVKGEDVILIGGTIDDANTMELYDLAQGIAHQGANSLKIIIPYFGYSTMERAVKTGEIVKAKNRALLFSSIPMCAEANQVYLLDLHSEGIP
ncbi:MAG TPA: ribose-phosphate pyrophosphokinase-like domain-containing protein, partial [Chitinophagaceae bacterium]|nr:ribose-phosphate pyrophosphokinase-like domain-containing protein [Chitinophagaceae bacterium]